MSDVNSGALQLNLENYTAEDGKLTLYVNHNQGTSFAVGKESFSVSLGKDELEVLNVQTVGETGVPVTYLCLVDVSGSLDKNRMEVMKETLSCLAADMREGDSVCIIAMGDELRSSGFLTDKEEIQAQIDALEVLHEDTNLYQGIEESLLLLQTDPNVAAKRCLLVLSDGAEDNTYGITREEVNARVQDSHIPIFTVGMIKNTENQSQLDSVKILGSFARTSAGGSHYVPALDDLSAEQIAEKIWTSVLGSQVITVDTQGLAPTGQELYLQVSVNAAGIGTASAGMNVADGNILSETPVETESGSEETTAAETESETTGETGTLQEDPVPDPQGMNMLVVAGIGIGIVLLIVILAAVFTRKKKKTAKPDPQTEGIPEELREEPQEEPSEDAEVDASKEGATEELADGEESGGEENAQAEEIQNAAQAPAVNVRRAGITVQLVRVGISETKSFSITVADSLSMGRNPELSAFALPEDKSLSGRHCTFYYRNGGLFLEDNGSTNGTYVNGIPIKETMRLNRDDILLIGSYEYRIYW